MLWNINGIEIKSSNQVAIMCGIPASDITQEARNRSLDQHRPYVHCLKEVHQELLDGQWIQRKSIDDIVKEHMTKGMHKIEIIAEIDDDDETIIHRIDVDDKKVM